MVHLLLGISYSDLLSHQPLVAEAFRIFNSLWSARLIPDVLAWGEKVDLAVQMGAQAAGMG